MEPSDLMFYKCTEGDLYLSGTKQRLKWTEEETRLEHKESTVDVAPLHSLVKINSWTTGLPFSSRSLLCKQNVETEICQLECWILLEVTEVREYEIER